MISKAIASTSREIASRDSRQVRLSTSDCNSQEHADATLVFPVFGILLRRYPFGDAGAAEEERSHSDGSEPGVVEEMCRRGKDGLLDVVRVPKIETRLGGRCQLLPDSDRNCCS